MLRLLCLALLPLFMGGSVWHTPSSLRIQADPFFSRIVVGQERVTTGQEQNLQITLVQSAGVTTIFQLVITYPSGVQQEVFAQTIGSEARLTWQIPPAVGVGVANFALTSTGCGCGERTRPANPSNSMSKAAGQFQIY